MKKNILLYRTFRTGLHSLNRHFLRTGACIRHDTLDYRICRIKVRRLCRRIYRVPSDGALGKRGKDKVTR